MSYKDSTNLIQEFIEKYGEGELERILKSRLTEKFDLTIIGNEGIHSIPAEFIHGEVYVASRGSLNFSSKKTIENEYETILRDLFSKLNERSWGKIYFVPTGHTTLALQIKQLVYHVLRQSTVDLFYSNGRYIELEFDYRKILIGETYNE